MSLVDGLLNQTITTIRSITLDAYNDVSASSTVYSNVPCRWQENSKLTVDQRERLSGAGLQSKIAEASVEVWLDSSYEISTDYEFVKGGEVYKVVAVEKKYDIDGVVDHVKVYLV